jgi:hypothetical protein
MSEDNETPFEKAWRLSRPIFPPVKSERSEPKRHCACPREDALDCANMRYGKGIEGRYDGSIEPCDCCCHEQYIEDDPHVIADMDRIFTLEPPEVDI